ncbi:hypothetical protein QNH20_18485 [Neobacillus sp. WH10]|uniref:hypothetical protein n=1 Tax=Neobacillus sp. WH10 TaxID=3047873 RepID=UPI0024C0F336|nr:hypothetical protein [Neobacillus sp. WH10]WHY76100.1 hypothetical protein QNH20_18485 [Neobacillus sp. WH10]
MFVKCIRNVHEFDDEDFEIQFIKDKTYQVEWKSKDDEFGYCLKNELDGDHYVGLEGDEWFGKHFIVANKE